MSGQAKICVVRAENVIICDDVRIENTGKEILIGIYSAALFVPALPYQLMLFVWLQLRMDTSADVPLKLRFSNTNGSTIIEVAFVLSPPKEDEPGHGISDLVTMAFRTRPFEIQSEGTLTLAMSQHGGDWETIKELPVRQGTQFERREPPASP